MKLRNLSIKNETIMTSIGPVRVNGNGEVDVDASFGEKLRQMHGWRVVPEPVAAAPVIVVPYMSPQEVAKAVVKEVPKPPLPQEVATAVVKEVPEPSKKEPVKKKEAKKKESAKKSKR